MGTYQEMVETYRKRRRDTVVDTLTAGLSYVDELAVDAGLLEESGILAELSGPISAALPFAVIAVSEGSKVILGKKPGATAGKDTAWRMLKSSAAMGVGAAVSSLTGFWAAIPATMGVRALFDSYRLKQLTGCRVAERTERLRQMNRMIREKQEAAASGKSEECPNSLSAL